MTMPVYRVMTNINPMKNNRGVAVKVIFRHRLVMDLTPLIGKWVFSIFYIFIEQTFVVHLLMFLCMSGAQ